VHVHLGASGFVGMIREPSPVRREHRLPLAEGTVQEHYGLARPPARRLVSLQRQDHQIEVRLWVQFLEREELAARMPRARLLGSGLLSIRAR